MKPTHRTLELDLSSEAWRRLERLGGAIGLSVASVVRVMLEHVDQGIQREGSWEREIAVAVFGEDAVEAAGTSEREI